jgi:hypothetical protein
MPDAFRPVFCDLSRGIFVESRKSLQATQLPWGAIVTSRNNLSLLVYPLVRNPNAGQATADPYSVPGVSGMSLVATVFSSDGATTLATGSTWTADDDAGTLAGNLNLNTVEMAAAATSLTGISVRVEFRFTGSGYEHSCLATSATIIKQLNYTGSPTVIPGDTYLTTAESQALFWQKGDNGAGAGFYLKSPDATKRGFIWWDNDGNFRADPVS